MKKHNRERTIVLPRLFRSSKAIDFLKNYEFAFTSKNKLVPDVVIDFSEVEEISLLNVLIFVKFAEFSSENMCFISPKYIAGDVMSKAFYRFGFIDLVKTYLEKIDEDQAYQSLRIKQENGFLIAPQGLLRKGDLSKHSLQQHFLPSVQSYYKDNSKDMFLIITCLSEIALNFWEHATHDKRSILVAYGNKSKIEIACADTGQGIITTLSNIVDTKKYNSGHAILCQAMGKGVTSKKNTDHMGYGLWLISAIAIATKATLYIYSEGAYYHIDRGKIKSGTCAYWKGTIFYLSLPLQTGLSLVDIVDTTSPEDDEQPTINWQ